MRRLPLLLLALVLPTSASAYEVMRAQQTNKELRWTSLPMKFNIHSTPAKGVSAAETQAAVRAAYKTWSNVSCSYYASQDLGVVSMPTGNESDSVNTNVWRATWPASFGQTALGITRTKYDPYAGKIIDADTHYNPNYTWSVSGNPYHIDVQAVATHEIGHQLGLDHSQYQDATMFYATGAGDTSQRSLHSDDIAGICHLYPTGTAPPPECTTAGHCAPNETCTNGKCVLASQKGYGGPCNSQKDCTTGLCLQSGSNTFCSVMCDSQPCPNGDQCLGLQGGGKACLPNSADMGTKLFGEPCKTNTDCTSQICVSVPGQGYLCTRKCDVNQDTCPQGYWCANSSVGGLCVPGSNPQNPPPPPPPPPKKKALGEACTASSDCESNLCGNTADGMVCVQLCDDANPCPVGFLCVPAGDKKACVKDKTAPPPPAPGALGAGCSKNEDCTSGMCATAADGRRFCTELCNPGQGCGQGYDCVPAGGDKHACTPSTQNLDEGGGCTITRAEDTRWLSLIFVLPLLLLLRSRRRE